MQSDNSLDIINEYKDQVRILKGQIGELEDANKSKDSANKRCLQKLEFCNKDFKKEIISTLNRRIVIPLYIPIIALMCALSLIKSKKIYFNKYFSFFYCFLLLLFTELAVRYTGMNNFILYIFIILPIFLFSFMYFFLRYKFSMELKHE